MRNSALCFAVLAASLIAPASGSTAAGDTFAGFAGHWRGAGTVSMVDGSREAIRCRAVYATSPGTDTLHLDVNCASDSYRVNIVADVQAQDRSFSGSWQETARQIRGEVAGVLPRPGQMQASLQTLGGGMQLGATSNGKRQAIAIRAQGAGIRGADITLNRR